MRQTIRHVAGLLASMLLASMLVAACAANASKVSQVRTVDEIDLQQG
jgi:predicted small secreted protein